MHAPRRLAVVALLVVFGAAIAPVPSAAQKERRGIFRGLIHTIAPGSPEDLAAQAVSARDVSTALGLYETLESRHGSRPEGVRASLWLGLYSYGLNDRETALTHFERARSEAKDPELRARADFWCDQARLLTGREPLAGDAGLDGSSFWGILRRLTSVDRSIQLGRRGEAEQELLSLEGEARRAGLLGPQIARWGDVLRMPGPGGRTNADALSALARATAELPERLQVFGSAHPAPTPPAQPEGEVWSVQFGAFLDQLNADALVKILDAKGLDTRIEEGEEQGRHWYRVRLSASFDRAAADSMGRLIQEKAGIPCQTVRSE